MVVENILNNTFIEFNISGTIAINEADKDATMLELSKLISAFLAHKDIIKLDNNIETIDTIDLVSYRQEPGEA